ncbi:MAG: Mut7-C RNAse domain-containing protein [Nitrospiria bacterium]
MAIAMKMQNSGYLARFRFYEGLNDFLPFDQRKKELAHSFRGAPAIKDPIEALGVPHTEIDLILVNGASVGFAYGLRHGDRVSVYPRLKCFGNGPFVELRDAALRKDAFILDVHLGKLAGTLRFLGFDIRYENSYADPEIARIAVDEKRIVLTRDRRLLFRKAITHAYFLRSSDPDRQLIEVFDRYDLYSRIKPYHRCRLCNGKIVEVGKQEVFDRLEPKTVLYYDRFYRCEQCRKIYWKGSHYGRIKKHLGDLLA